nr:hypothetical protein [Tanacetum cinerariifolium]
SREVWILSFLGAYFIALREDTQHLSMGDFGNGYSRNGQKQAKNNKTKYKMEKIEKDEVNRSRKTKVKTLGQQKSTLNVKVNPGNVNVNPDKKPKQKNSIISSSSTVTDTSVYTNSEPVRVFWGADEELSDGGSLRVIVYIYDGLPMQPVAPPSPNYMPGPEHPPAPIEVPYVPELEYPEYLAPSDKESPVEDQPYAVADSPIALSPGYVADSDLEEDSKDGLVDYPADGGDDDDEPSDNDDDDEDEEPFEEEDDDDEEHIALADSFDVLVVDPVPSAEDTKALETEVERLLALPTPPRSLLTPLSSQLPPLPASLSIPSPVDHREETPEAELPPRKRLCLNTPTSRYEVGESSTAAPRPTGGHRADYGFISTIDNNMPPKRTSAAVRAAAAARAATAASAPMTVAAVEHLIEARVSAALPLTFNGTEGVVVLAQWFKKMESVFHISNCAMENQVKFATCTFLRNALTWWNSHMKAVTQDVAYTMYWKKLMKMMTDKYCPRGEIKKMFHEESDEVEKYVGGLPDVIRGNVMSYQPKSMAKAIESANDQMDQKVLTISEKQAEQKRNIEFNAGNNQGYQQQNKRQNTERAYTPRPGEKRECNKCKKVGHLAHDCRSFGPNCNNNNHGNSGITQNVVTCSECGVQGYYKKDSLKLKNGNRSNQCGNANALAKVYAVGNAGTNLDSNVVTGTFFLNNRYASILFETSSDRSFVSNTFSSLIDIIPTTLDHYYYVELADEKIIGVNTIIWGCTLNLLDHSFNINLMPIELGSFDIIVGMDWLAKYHAVIDCAKKIVCIT